MAYSFQKEYYDKALIKMLHLVNKKLDDADVVLENVWEWFKAEYPAAHKKYQIACEKVSKFFEHSSDIEEFKKATKLEMDAYIFLVDKYIEHKKNLTGVAA